MQKEKAILIVEDNEADRYLLKRSFNEAGIKNEIVFANDGTEAFDILMKEDFKPFMIIADINMPGMTGLQLKKKLDAQDQLKTVPFIFMTNSKGRSEVEAAYALKAQGYFEKRDLEDQTHLVQIITRYWKEAEVPDK